MSALKEKPVHIKTLFDYLDTNNDGVLSFSEAKVALEGKVPPSTYKEVFEAYDADHNGTLDVKEFTKLCRMLDGATLSTSGRSSRSVVDTTWWEQTLPHEVLQTYKLFDKNSDGQLSLMEMHAGLKLLGVPVALDAMPEFMKRCARSRVPL